MKFKRETRFERWSKKTKQPITKFAWWWTKVGDYLIWLEDYDEYYQIEAPEGAPMFIVRVYRNIIKSDRSPWARAGPRWLAKTIYVRDNQ